MRLHDFASYDRTLVAVGLLLTVAGAACTARSDSPERSSQRSTALSGAFPDADTPEADVVVQITGTNTLGGLTTCTGIFISPIAVLTAKHCIAGAEAVSLPPPIPFVAAIPPTPPPYTIFVGSSILSPNKQFFNTTLPAVLFGPDIPITPDEPGVDLAIIFLDPSNPTVGGQASSPFPAFGFAHIIRPTLTAPSPGGSDTNGGTYGSVFPNGPIGFAGWAPADAPLFRQALLWIPSVTLHHYPGFPLGNGITGQYWDKERDTQGGTNPGDSGGPVFVERPQDGTPLAGTRDVIGVFSGNYGVPDHALDCGFGVCSVWTDITRGAPASFVTDTMHDGTRTPEWLAKHGRTGPDPLWFGEFDYTGPCRSGSTPLTNDTDCDHWFDAHDYCPVFFNPAQLENDPCGRCPLVNSPNADPDNDHVCNPNDNCPNAWNADQHNCNDTAEKDRIARGLPTAILGDACDPVPCPYSNADAVRQTGPNGPPNCTQFNQFTGSTCVGRWIHDDLRTAPIGSSPVFQVSSSSASTISIPLDQVPTDARFCQSNPMRGFDCNDPPIVRDSQLGSTPEPETLDKAYPWHQVKFTGQDRGVMPALNYNSFTVSDFTWEYLADDAFWHRDPANPVIPPPFNYASCSDTSTFGAGTCLDGTFWLHGETFVGTASLPDVGGIPVGVHPTNATELANHYFDIRPDDARLWRINALSDSPLQNHVLIWQTLPDPGPDGSQRLVWGEKMALPLGVQPTTGEVLGMQIGRASTDLSPYVSTLASHALHDSGIVTVNAAEPSPFIGGAANLPEAVLLSSDSTRLIDSVQAHAGQLLLSSEIRPGGPAGNDPPSPRTNFVSVFSRAAGAIFVLGGVDATTHAILHDVWMHPLDTEWTPVNLTGAQLGEVLASTYSFQDSRLWVLDRGKNKHGHLETRLLALDPIAGTSMRVTTVHDVKPGDRFWLVVDNDGGILLAVSNSAQAKYRITKLRVGEDGASFSCVAKGKSTLAFAPIVDTRGYSFILAQANDLLKLVRRVRLTGCGENDGQGDLGGNDDGDSQGEH